MTADLVDINTGEIAPTRLGMCPEKDCGRSAFADLVAALGKLQEPGKGGRAQVGGRGTYTYMTLPDLLEAVRQPLAEHHLAVMQEVVTDERGVTVTSVLLHASGYAFRSPALTLRSGPGPQDIGSASTYGRRYTLAAMVGLAGAEDDDAQQASKRPPPQTPGGGDTPVAKAPNGAPVPKAARPPDPNTTPPAPPTAAGGVDTRAQAASPASRKLMWTLISKNGMTPDQARDYVADYLHIPPDWHTADLTQTQVSGVINALKADLEQSTVPPPGDTKNWGDE